MGKPFCREFILAIGHITTAEHAERQHFGRGQFRPEGRIEVGRLRHVTPPWGHPSLGVSFLSQRLAWARTFFGAVPP